MFPDCQIFEWWYFRKYGTSFIEQVSLNHLSPWLGGSDSTSSETSPANTNNNTPQPSVPGLSFCFYLASFHLASFYFCKECKVWRNPLNLLRGGEYQRFTSSTGKDPLTYYDMNLSAQDHQTYFTCEADVGKQEYESEFLKATIVSS